MPQQINLCSPVQYAIAQPFTAVGMAKTLAAIVVLGAVIAAGLSVYMARSTSAYRVSLQEQDHEIQALKTAMETARANAGPADAALLQQLQARQTELTQRQSLLDALRQGAVTPGFGHSDRLQLIAQSIPPMVWVTGLWADSNRLEVSGYTLEPAALNLWVSKLAQSPLMRGLQLATVKVEYASRATSSAAAGPMEALAAVGAAPAPAPLGVPPGRQVWSFQLVSAQRAVAADAGAPPSASAASDLKLTGVRP